MKKYQRNKSPFSKASQPKAKQDELFIHDEVGYFGVSSLQFIKDLSNIDGGDVTIRINSPGGEVFDGVAIYHALNDHNGKTITRIDGIAASIASIIALGSDEVNIVESGYIMIHQVSSIVWGNAADFRKEANLLDKLDSTIVDIYAKRMDLDTDSIKSLMVEETWFTAQEALDAGLVDNIIEGGEVSAKFDLSVYNHAPEKLLEGIPAPKDIERALRDAGLSVKQAKAYMANSKKSLDPRDVDQNEIDTEESSSLKALSLSFKNQRKE